MKCATAGLACSPKAAIDLYGGGWEQDKRWRLLYCGIDLSPFRVPADRSVVRKELGIAENAYVLGHVGRFSEVKNHTLLVDIFAEVVRREPQAHLLLVGDGALRKNMEKKVSELGLEAKVCFAGLRSDVPRVMQGAMDIFVFPSLYEGLGLVLIEAQAAGLPCVITETLPAEVDVVAGAIKRMDLASPLEQWATTIISLRKNRVCKQAALTIVEKSIFNLTRSINSLVNYY
jgi:glycosyltransferase involved in cell wall biosynthesis